jgi:hypothetical protein
MNIGPINFHLNPDKLANKIPRFDVHKKKISSKNKKKNHSVEQERIKSRLFGFNVKEECDHVEL